MREQLFTTSDFARIINRSPDRVRQLARAGVIVPAVITSRGERLFTPAEADRYKQHLILTAAAR